MQPTMFFPQNMFHFPLMPRPVPFFSGVVCSSNPNAFAGSHLGVPYTPLEAYVSLSPEDYHWGTPSPQQLQVLHSQFMHMSFLCTAKQSSPAFLEQEMCVPNPHSWNNGPDVKNTQSSELQLDGCAALVKNVVDYPYCIPESHQVAQHTNVRSDIGSILQESALQEILGDYECEEPLSSQLLEDFVGDINMSTFVSPCSPESPASSLFSSATDLKPSDAANSPEPVEGSVCTIQTPSSLKLQDSFQDLESPCGSNTMEVSNLCRLIPSETVVAAKEVAVNEQKAGKGTFEAETESCLKRKYVDLETMPLQTSKRATQKLVDLECGPVLCGYKG